MATTTNFLTPRYERVTYRSAEGRLMTVKLKIASETATRLSGYAVNTEGDEPVKVRTLHVMSLTDITKRVPLVLDKMYGWLVPSGTETK